MTRPRPRAAEAVSRGSPRPPGAGGACARRDQTPVALL